MSRLRCALEALERACADRSHGLVFANVVPRLDALCADPLFAGVDRPRVAA